MLHQYISSYSLGKAVQ
uniref:Uncharacterized protein n=1 Tax=Arundo donax TaxID=35708 RepID=A0A0A9GL34_ARUDO